MRTTASILIILVFTSFIHSQSTDFTYQGRLTDGTLPASGNYQMQFSLFGSLADPDQIGSTITVSSVTVTQGVFTVTLNIDVPNAFDGGPRWLAIAVKRLADPDYTPLTPRQPLTSTPYAIKSKNASTADVAINSTKLGGKDADEYVLTGDGRLSDERAPTAGSDHYIQNGLATQPTSNFNIDGSGLIAGNLGVGTTTPSQKLVVSGTGFVRAQVNSDFNGGVSLALNNEPKWSLATALPGQFQIYNDAIGQNAVWIDPTNNNFGIGTFTPGSKLDVGGAINTSSQYNIGGNRILTSPGNGNLFAGFEAGTSTTSGGSNAYFGTNAGRSSTVGNGNSFFGAGAGENSMTGNANSFFGVVAGQNSTGTNNSFFGASSGRASTGANNAFFGYQSGMANASGQLNAFFGSGAGNANTTGGFNSFFGAIAGSANVGGTLNSFFGTEAGDSNINGHSNSFFGRKAGDANTDGSVNVFIGIAAGQSNTTGHYNTIVGGDTNVTVSDLQYASAFGARARVGTSDTIVLGKVAGTYDGVARPADTVHIPGDLTVVGAINGTVLNATNAVNATTAGNALNLGGVAANQFVQTNDSRLSDFRNPLPGSANYIQNGTSLQASSDFNISGTGTLGGTLNANVVNAATQFEINGFRALTMDLNASSVYGGFIGSTLPTGDLNTFFGMLAGSPNTGNRNSFFGNRAGNGNLGGSFNAFFGVGAGETNVSGSENTMLGFRAQPATGALTNATAIGANSQVTQSNSLILGSIAGVNNATADTNVGIGTTAPGQRLHVVGNGLFTGDLTVNGTLNATLPITGNYIQNQSGTQQAGSFNLAGTGTVSGTLSGGSVNTATRFEINGGHVLSAPGSANLFVGHAGNPFTLGAGNIFVGHFTGLGTTGSGNAFVGLGTGNNNTSGSFNSFFGSAAGLFAGGTGLANTTGNFNSFFGHRAGESSNGDVNSFFGTGAGFANTDGDGNTFIGHDSGNSNTTGSFNTTLGENADVGADLTNATAIGSKAVVSISNTLILGSIAGLNGAGADTSVGIGTTAPNARLEVRRVTPATEVGTAFAATATGGTLNIGVRGHGGGGNTNFGVWGSASFGTSNWAGYFEGNTFVDGNFGVGSPLVGFPPAPLSKLHLGSSNGNLAVTFTNESHTVGFRTYRLAYENERMRFQRADDAGNVIADHLVINQVTGNVGIGNANPTDKLNVNGNVSLLLAGGGGTDVCQNASFQLSVCSSSIRYKNNVNHFSSGLGLIIRLRPVTFNWKANNMQDMGLVAEDVARVEPLLVTHNDKGEVEGVKYDRIGVVLINVVKEQQAQIDQQQKEIENLKKIVCELKPSAGICKEEK